MMNIIILLIIGALSICMIHVIFRYRDVNKRVKTNIENIAKKLGIYILICMIMVMTSCGMQEFPTCDINSKQSGQPIIMLPSDKLHDGNDQIADLLDETVWRGNALFFLNDSYNDSLYNLTTF